MVVRKIIIICLYLFFGCSGQKNEFGKVRINSKKFSLETNNNDEIFKLIDTSSIYVFNQVVENSDSNSKLKVLHKLDKKKTGIKFYANGKVGKFDYFNIENTLTLDPRKAIMGIYNFDKGNLLIEFLSYSPQIGYEPFKEEYLIKKDTIVSVGKIQDIYVRQKLSKEQLIYKPDW